MDLQIAKASFELRPRVPLRLEVGAGHRLTGISGVTWLTIDKDPRDIILEPGDTHVFDAPGRAMVVAMGGTALINAEDGIQARPSVLSSLIRRGAFRS